MLCSEDGIHCTPLHFYTFPAFTFFELPLLQSSTSFVGGVANGGMAHGRGPRGLVSVGVARRAWSAWAWPAGLVSVGVARGAWLVWAWPCGHGHWCGQWGVVGGGMVSGGFEVPSVAELLQAFFFLSTLNSTLSPIDHCPMQKELL